MGMEDALISPPTGGGQLNRQFGAQNQQQSLSKLTAALISPTGSFGTAVRSPSAMLTKSRTRLGSLMMQVCTLRSVNFEHSQSILQIDVQRKEDIGPFLREMLVTVSNGGNQGANLANSSLDSNCGTQVVEALPENDSELAHDENTITLTTL